MNAYPIIWMPGHLLPFLYRGGNRLRVSCLLQFIDYYVEFSTWTSTVWFHTLSLTAVWSLDRQHPHPWQLVRYPGSGWLNRKLCGEVQHQAPSVSGAFKAGSLYSTLFPDQKRGLLKGGKVSLLIFWLCLSNRADTRGGRPKGRSGGGASAPPSCWGPRHRPALPACKYVEFSEPSFSSYQQSIWEDTYNCDFIHRAEPLGFGSRLILGRGLGEEVWKSPVQLNTRYLQTLSPPLRRYSLGGIISSISSRSLTSGVRGQESRSSGQVVEVWCSCHFSNTWEIDLTRSFQLS